MSRSKRGAGSAADETGGNPPTVPTMEAAIIRSATGLRKCGNSVTVRSTLLSFEGKKIRFRHEMVNNDTGEVAAVTTLLGVHMDTVARKSCAFPDELIARGRPLLAAAQ